MLKLDSRKLINIFPNYSIDRESITQIAITSFVRIKRKKKFYLVKVITRCRFYGEDYLDYDGKLYLKKHLNECYNVYLFYKINKGLMDRNGDHFFDNKDVFQGSERKRLFKIT